jgi:hypothetical protein
MASGIHDVSPRLVGDERWALVQRIAASEPFQKSTRLRSFLLYITERALGNHLEDIHEQQIGCHVYGKRPDYNASEDNIVRVDARRLRRALEDYFASVGCGEPLILHIPKGSYVPVFEARNGGPEAAEASPTPVRSVAKLTPLLYTRKARPLVTPLALAGVIVFAALALWQWSDARSLRRELEAAAPASEPGIWSYVFDAQHRTTIVLADVGFSILQGRTKTRLSLRDYLDQRYAQELATGDLSHLARIKMSVFVDVGILSDILRANPRFGGSTTVKHARDLHLQDFKEGHHILVGSRAANPWCEIFVGERNFLYEYDTSKGRSYFRNRNPRAGE